MIRDITRYLRANPQVLALLVICLVLGVGTFVAVLVSLVTTPSGQATGEPSGVVWALGTAMRTLTP